MAWSEKRAGFESGSSGNCRWGRTERTGSYLPPDFEQWRIGLIMWIIEQKTPYYETEDRSIVTIIEGVTYMMTPSQQNDNYQRYIRKWRGHETR